MLLLRGSHPLPLSMVSHFILDDRIVLLGLVNGLESLKRIVLDNGRYLPVVSVAQLDLLAQKISIVHGFHVEQLVGKLAHLYDDMLGKVTLKKQYDERPRDLVPCTDAAGVKAFENQVNRLARLVDRFNTLELNVCKLALRDPIFVSNLILALLVLHVIVDFDTVHYLRLARELERLVEVGERVGATLAQDTLVWNVALERTRHAVFDFRRGRSHIEHGGRLVAFDTTRFHILLDSDHHFKLKKRSVAEMQPLAGELFESFRGLNLQVLLLVV